MMFVYSPRMQAHTKYLINKEQKEAKSMVLLLIIICLLYDQILYWHNVLRSILPFLFPAGVEFFIFHAGE